MVVKIDVFFSSSFPFPFLTVVLTKDNKISRIKFSDRPLINNHHRVLLISANRQRGGREQLSSNFDVDLPYPSFSTTYNWESQPPSISNEIEGRAIISQLIFRWTAFSRYCVELFRRTLGRGPWMWGPSLGGALGGSPSFGRKKVKHDFGTLIWFGWANPRDVHPSF